jgi:DUF971 family protein
VISEVDIIEASGPKPDVIYDPKDGFIYIKRAGKIVKKVSPYELRLACKCAGCIDEIDGRQILKTEQVPKDVHPTNIHTKGNYAVAMVWSDGHRSSIYPFARILSSELNDH